jgi:type IV secretory pathway ATPase VirB11/archaellum biosynthesis ATPase
VKALNQPESWWGWHGWNQPEPLSITQIMRAGTLSPRVAALLWLVMERGRSMILAAEPPGAGKTTLLTALLAFTRPEASVYFTRGWGETFRLPPLENGAPTYLMINEISDHLPVYSWGPYVQKSFELLRDGYSLLSTMHAETVDGVIEQLVDENDVPQEHVGHLAFVVPMYVGAYEGRRVRRVSEVAVLEPLAASYDRQSVARWLPETDTFSVLATPAEINAAARRLDLDDGDLVQEVAKRESFLAELLAADVSEMEDVQRRVSEFSGYEVVE